MAEIKLRGMRRDELDIVLDWAADEGWNPGLSDAEPFFATDPTGFFVATRDGATVAAISVVNHDPGLAFLGLFLCRPEHRGQGIGRALWDHALAHAGARSVALDGVPAQQAFYARAGFESVGETCRWEGSVPARRSAAIRPARPGDLPGLIAMDTAANGYNKHAFLSGWLADTPDRRTLVHETDGRRLGFVTWRRCRSGVKLGPLAADTIDTAWTLVTAASAAVDEETLIFDVPAAQTTLTECARDARMHCSFVTARMIRGDPPRRQPLVATPATLELG